MSSNFRADLCQLVSHVYTRVSAVEINKTMDSSPFNRSTMTSRSPPPRRRYEEEPPSTPTARIPEPVSTPEIQQWLNSIEQCLNEICNITGEGKLNTEQKLKVSTISRKVLGGVSHLAVQYQSLKQKYISAQSVNQYLNEQISDTNLLENQIKELKESIESVPKVQTSAFSFADVVRKNNNVIVRPQNTPSITIYPADKEKSSEETKKIIQTIIKPDELKLHIRGMRKTKSGGVIISTQDKADLEKLKKSEQLKTSGFKVEDTTKKLPKIILLGIPSNIGDKEVYECIYEQNICEKCPQISRDRFISTVKLSHKSGKKDSNYCNYILEVPADIRRVLIQQERVYINWTSCPVRDFTMVTRCFKCQQYGHSAKYCREVDSICGHCGCAGHTIKECTKRDEPAKCATCRRFNKPSEHRTGEEQCPARKSAETRYLSLIDYEGA